MILMRRRWRETMSDNPWSDLAPPSAADAFNARRVDAELQWDFFWARSVDRRCLLVLRHSGASAPAGKLPNLKGIEITQSATDGDERSLAFKLLDSAQLDLFYRLCLDIIEASHGAASEKEAVAATLARTWRWHHLLRGGSDRRLSPNQQKGLIGELLVLESLLLPRLSAADAVSSWKGPLGAPKDFEIGRVAIEAKARRGAATPFIALSSEHQLDTSGVDTLFLHVAELDDAPSDARTSVSVSDVVRRVRGRILEADNAAVEPFDSLVLAAGYRDEDDYSDSLWVEGPSSLYEVVEGFPRITSDQVMSGVSYVRYSVSLVECEPFRSDQAALARALSG